MRAFFTVMAIMTVIDSLTALAVTVIFIIVLMAKWNQLAVGPVPDCEDVNPLLSTDVAGQMEESFGRPIEGSDF